jgi:hypothetical protein
MSARDALTLPLPLVIEHFLAQKEGLLPGYTTTVYRRWLRDFVLVNGDLLITPNEIALFLAEQAQALLSACPA